MSQAIEVKQHMDNNGNMKYIAFCAAKRKYFYRDLLQQELRKNGKSINTEAEATLAAEKLRDQLEWVEEYYGKMVLGTLKNGNFVFVFTGRQPTNNLADKENNDTTQIQSSEPSLAAIRVSPGSSFSYPEPKSGAASHLEVTTPRIPNK